MDAANLRTLYSARILENMEKSLMFKEATNTDFEGEIAGKGSVLRILNVPRPTRNSYTQGDSSTAITYEVLKPVASTFALDQDVYWAIREDQLRKTLSNPDTFEKSAREGAYVLADGEDQYLSIQMGSKAGTTLDSAVVGNGGGDDKAYDVLVKLRTKMNELNIPANDRHVFVPEWFFEMLQLDQRFTGYGTSESRKTIRDAIIDRLAGFMVYPNNNNTDSTGAAIASASATVHTVVAALGGATTRAAHIPPEGLVQTFSSAQNPTNFDNLMRARHVFGAEVIRPEGLVKVVCTKGS